MSNTEYYHRQADFCLRMALSASRHEERLRLLHIANGYRAFALSKESGDRQATYSTRRRRSGFGVCGPATVPIRSGSALQFS
jgi:hypothetical protein